MLAGSFTIVYSISLAWRMGQMQEFSVNQEATQ